MFCVLNIAIRRLARRRKRCIIETRRAFRQAVLRCPEPEESVRQQIIGKMLHKWPKITPRMVNKCRKGPKLTPKWAQDAPKLAQDGPKLAPEAPKMSPKGPQEGPQIDPKSVFQGLPTSKPKKGDPRSI